FPQRAETLEILFCGDRVGLIRLTIRSYDIFGAIQDCPRPCRDLLIETDYMSHHHPDTARACSSTDRLRVGRAVNAQIGVAVSGIKVKSARPKRVGWAGIH